jgi:membrane-associated protease RseP (regulator of RpoE activity)
MRASLRVYLLLYLCYLVHECGHAVFDLLAGCTVDTFALGVGPGLHGYAFGTMWKLGVVPLGAYVIHGGNAPWWVEVLGSLAGPAASIGVIPLLHPHGLRLLATLVVRAVRQYGWRVARDVPRAYLVWVLRSWLTGIEASRSRNQEDAGVWAKIPVLDMLLLWRGWSFWSITFFLGVINLLPFPPMDGARTLLYLLPQTETVTTGYGVMSVATLVIFLVLAPGWSIAKHLFRKVQDRRRAA